MSGENWTTKVVPYTAEVVRKTSVATKTTKPAKQKISDFWYLVIYWGAIGFVLFALGWYTSFGGLYVDALGVALMLGSGVFYLAEKAPEYRRTLRSYLGIAAVILTVCYAKYWSAHAELDERIRQMIEAAAR